MKHMMEFWDDGPANNDKVFTKGPIGDLILELQENLKAFVDFLAFTDVELPTPDPEILQNNDIKNFYLLGGCWVLEFTIKNCWIFYYLPCIKPGGIPTSSAYSDYFFKHQTLQ